MLLRSLPDLAACSAKFRQQFHSRWGQENCIVAQRTQFASFGPIAHSLSIRAAWGGTEHCQVGGRDISVDDDNFLILNPGRVYATRIDSLAPVDTLSICFRPELVESAWAAMAASLDRALAQGDAVQCRTPDFMENLQPHDGSVSPVLRFIRSHLLQGLEDESWYEEQLHFLLERLLAHHTRLLRQMDSLQLIRSTTRRELCRRIGFATDFLHSNYSRPLELGELAQVACLSKYHFLRVFTLVHGITPFAYLQRKRTGVALRLLQTTRLTLDEVANYVGCGQRSTVIRQIRRLAGLGPMDS